MDQTSIIHSFLKEGVNIHPDTLREIQNSENPELLIQSLLRRIAKTEKPPVLLPEHLTPVERIEKDLSIIKSKEFYPIAKDIEEDIKIISDITGKSFCEGKIENFVEFFNDRYKKICTIFKERIDFRDFIPISHAKRLPDRRVRVVGMVSSISETSKGRVMMSIEDPTGTINAILPNPGEKDSKIVNDEVLGLEGHINRGLFIVDRFARPDVPVRKTHKKVDDPVSVVLLSDLHVGSKEFLEKEFLRFLSWLNGGIGRGDQRALAESVKYIIIAGDIVDGIGVYPNQEEDLLIDDVSEQYDQVTRLLSHIPEHISIIISPGNHDAVRFAEPQPSLPRDIAGALYELPNVTMVGNPAYISLHGINFLIYHGRSLDDMVASISGLSYQSPSEIMIELLKRRHLAPIYGERTSIAPEKEDYLVIDRVPDVFHSGHIHTVGVTNYRGILVANSGAWQTQTEYQRTLNLIPDPCRVPVINLNTFQTTVMRFKFN
ncbi:MAG: DNA-directed DNA polymerase II small subunit [Candidatus Hydrothermarchaeota archaeon]